MLVIVVSRGARSINNQLFRFIQEQDDPLLFLGARITNKLHDFVCRMRLRSKHRLDKLTGKAEEEEAKIRGLTEIRQN